jgi:CDP-ribitol ribitolphosphotransferase
MTCLIRAISWERVHLSLTATLPRSSDAPGNVQFMIVDGARVFPVKTTPVDDGRYRLEINVTNFRDRRPVPDGTWRFVPYIGGQPGPATGHGRFKITL